MGKCKKSSGKEKPIDPMFPSTQPGTQQTMTGPNQFKETHNEERRDTLQKQMYDYAWIQLEKLEETSPYYGRSGKVARGNQSEIMSGPPQALPLLQASSNPPTPSSASPVPIYTLFQRPALLVPTWQGLVEQTNLWEIHRLEVIILV
ncbi:hypothetical protein Pcinc_008171 [Petrolisthes cinctipes]|uniref:Uncharacterized protein n=1 Tax=Petrolisthes cinctipes TaxID=88211 RepID=A0AAE1F595_PETCI|nr:hypothetical protein Pcinc_026762 [Petrolisthes cinctipes]KAK3887734.1 hypothetical protein Pcinc_008171 [Petrolisthes cinctipes]